jgi:two-component system invasion response regulator UvrY
VKIIIADDHQLIRKCISLILTDTYKDICIEEVSNGQELLAKVRAEKWDIIISDISMPGRSGMEVIKEIRQLSPATPLLVFSSHPPEQYALRIIKAGVSCYLTKESASEELISAIEQLRKGKKYFTQEVTELLASSIEDNCVGKAHTKLTDREFEVMKHLVSGKTPSEISRSFSVSRNMVSVYKTRIFQKLQMDTTADLVRYAIENHL